MAELIDYNTEGNSSSKLAKWFLEQGINMNKLANACLGNEELSSWFSCYLNGYAVTEKEYTNLLEAAGISWMSLILALSTSQAAKSWLISESMKWVKKPIDSTMKELTGDVKLMRLLDITYTPEEDRQFIEAFAKQDISMSALHQLVQERVDMGQWLQSRLMGYNERYNFSDARAEQHFSSLAGGNGLLYTIGRMPDECYAWLCKVVNGWLTELSKQWLNTPEPAKQQNPKNYDVFGHRPFLPTGINNTQRNLLLAEELLMRAAQHLYLAADADQQRDVPVLGAELKNTASVSGSLLEMVGMLAKKYNG